MFTCIFLISYILSFGGEAWGKEKIGVTQT
jgi:hypothetical protein